MVNCALFLIGTKTPTVRETMSDLKTEAGEVHKRLMRNLCPKCESPLQVVEKTEENLTRRCERCRLTVQDKTKDAEMPKNVCD